MASLDDLNSTQKGGVIGIGVIAQAQKQLAAPGQTLSSTASPKATVVSNLSTSSVQVIGSSAFRRGIMFASGQANGTNAIWIVPSNVSATANVGIPLLGQSTFLVPTGFAVNAAFNAIASTGSANVLTIIEFF